jgi:cell division protease FtsH
LTTSAVYGIVPGLHSVYHPIGAFGFLWFMMMRQQGGGSNINAFGKSKARVVTNETNKITFATSQARMRKKMELAEIVEFMKNLENLPA